MNAKHTPGPWKFSKVNSTSKDGYGHYVFPADENSDFSILVQVVDPEVELANARLIAAAPDLLAAAKKVMAGLDARIEAAPSTAKPVFNGIADLHDAINKAEAQS